VGSVARGVDQLDRGRIGSVKARGGVRLAGRRSACSGTRELHPAWGAHGIRSGARALAQSVDWLVGLDDELIGPSPWVMNNIYIYEIKRSHRLVKCSDLFTEMIRLIPICLSFSPNLLFLISHES
jgi:hypothetical protein